MKSRYPWRHREGFKLGAGSDSKSKNSAAARGIAYHKRVYRLLKQQLVAEGQLHIEPWFEAIDGQVKRTMRSPDAVILYPEEACAIVVEVKMNWADGRDEKLINEYLPIVASAFRLDTTFPLLITSCLRGYPHSPLLGLQQFDQCLSWSPGRPTPLLLLP